jgi:hypothetical protein
VDKTDDTNGIGAPGEGWFFGSPHPAAARMLLGERSHRVGEGLDVQRVAAAVLEEHRRLPADRAPLKRACRSMTERVPASPVRRRLGFERGVGRSGRGRRHAW